MRVITDISTKTDDLGRLRLAGLHDSQLNAFKYSYRERLEFSLSGANAELTHFQINKPLILNVESLWEGSIVDTVYAWTANAIPDAIWNELENGWNALLERRIDPPARRKKAAQLISQHPDAILVVVSCSYGGNWSVLGQTISISQE